MLQSWHAAMQLISILHPMQCDRTVSSKPLCGVTGLSIALGLLLRSSLVKSGISTLSCEVWADEVAADR